jgi:hypothetical protein
MIGFPGIKDPANLTGLSVIKQNKNYFSLKMSLIIVMNNQSCKHRPRFYKREEYNKIESLTGLEQLRLVRYITLLYIHD